MIRAAENAKSHKKAGNLRNPKNWRDRLSELLPEEWVFDPLEEKVDEEPDNATSWFELGEEERERGYFRDALASYEKAIQLNPDYDVAFLRSAQACLALQEYNSAVKQSSRALEKDPEMIEAYSTRALAYERLQNYEEAIKDHNVALALKVQPARAKPRRSLASELVGKIYRFYRDEVANPLHQKTESLVRNPLMSGHYVQQTLQAMRSSVAKSFRKPLLKKTEKRKIKIKKISKVEQKPKKKRK